MRACTLATLEVVTTFPETWSPECTVVSLTSTEMICGAALGSARGTFVTGFGAIAPLGGEFGPGAPEAGGDGATGCEGVAELFAGRAGGAEGRPAGPDPAPVFTVCEWPAGEGEPCGCAGRLQDGRQSRTTPM